MIEKIFLISSICIISPSLAATSIGQCVNLAPISQADALNITCLGVVDYKYFLPTAVSTVYLEQVARNQLSDPSLSSLPTQCQVSLKKAVCASVYLKCPPNFLETNLSTYNYKIFSDVRSVYPLPFQRPCVSICNNANRDCLGLLNLKKRALNCSATTDYSYGAFGVAYRVPSYPFPRTYDSKFDTSVCNAMPAINTVAGTSEPYIHASTNGVCAGIVTSLYVPPGNLLSSNVAPMQGPYVVQSIIEAQLAASINALPVWLSPSCHFAMRKYFCGSYMLAPQPQRFRDVLVANSFDANTILGIQYQLGLAGVNVSAYLKSTFYLPSYPTSQVCLDYLNSCGTFINASKVSTLVPHCQTVVKGVIQFPSANQTIATVDLSPGLSIKYTTAPNKMSTASDQGYKPICPDGFVLSDTPDSERNVNVPASGCAIPCRTNLWTAEQFKIIDRIVVIGPAVAHAINMLLFVSWWIFNVKDRLVGMFAFAAGVNTVWFLIMAVSRGRSTNPDSFFCLNNAVQLRQSDGPSICIVQGVLLHFSTLVCSFAFCFMGLDLMQRVTGNSKNYMKSYLVIAVALPLLFVILNGAYGQYGYDGALPYCLFQYDASTTLGNLFFYIPLIVTIVFGDIFFTAATLNLICAKRTRASTGDNVALNGRVSPLEKLSSKGLKALLLFFLLFIAFWVSVFVYRLQEMLIHPKLVRSFEDWVACIFVNFKDSDRSNARAVCGNLPKLTVSFPFSSWAFLWLTCHSLLVAGIYLPSLWIDHFSMRYSLSTKVGVADTIEGMSPMTKEENCDDGFSKNKKNSGGDNVFQIENR